MKVAVKVDRAEADCQATILLARIGTEAYCVYESMTQTDMRRTNTTDILEAFKRHCISEVSEVFQIPKNVPKLLSFELEPRLVPNPNVFGIG